MRRNSSRAFSIGVVTPVTESDTVDESADVHSQCYQMVRKILRQNKDIQILNGADQALSILHKLRGIIAGMDNFKLLDGIICNRIGIILQYEKRDFQAAIDMHYRHLQTAKTLKDRSGLAKAFGNIGFCLYSSGQLNQALGILNDSIRYSQYSNKINLARAYGYIALVYIALDKYDEALEYLGKSLGLHLLLNDYQNIAINYAHIAWIHQHLKSYNDALCDYENCLKISKTYDFIPLITFAKSGIAKCLYYLQKYNESIEMSTKCLANLQLLDSKWQHMAIEYSNIACCALRTSQYQYAKEISNQVLNIINNNRHLINSPVQQLTLMEEEKKAYSWLILAECRLGNDINALLAYFPPLLIIWFIFKNHSMYTRGSSSPTSSPPIKLLCKEVDLSIFNISNIRKYISDSRREMGFRGWKYVDKNISTIFHIGDEPVSSGATPGIMKNVLDAVDLQLQLQLGRTSRISLEYIMKTKESIIHRSSVFRKLRAKYHKEDEKVSTDSQAVSTSRTLYSLLIKLYENEMLKMFDGEDLLIVTHDVISLVPFPALRNAEGICMVCRYKIRQIPSIIFAWDLTNTAKLKRTLNQSPVVQDLRLWKNIFVGGKKIFNDHNILEHSNQEIFDVVDLFRKKGLILTAIYIDKGPNVADVCQALHNSSLIHLATHATPLGYLVLKGIHNHSGDSYFKPKHIYDTYAAMGDIRPDLVVLNCCTLITDSYIIDSVDGIVRALLSCGVSCVVSTICDVSDQEADLLIHHFYSALLGFDSATDPFPLEGIALDSIEALQAAMLKGMRDCPGVDASPQNWAGYVATGLSKIVSNTDLYTILEKLKSRTGDVRLGDNNWLYNVTIVIQDQYITTSSSSSHQFMLLVGFDVFTTWDFLTSQTTSHRYNISRMINMSTFTYIKFREKLAYIRPETGTCISQKAVVHHNNPKNVPTSQFAYPVASFYRTGYGSAILAEQTRQHNFTEILYKLGWNGGTAYAGGVVGLEVAWDLFVTFEVNRINDKPIDPSEITIKCN
eukprot:gene5568-11204_t